MNRKQLIAGSALVLGICLLLANRLSEIPAAVFADTSPGSATRDHSSAYAPSKPLKVRSTDDGRRSNLIEKLNAIVRSGQTTDSERFSSLLVRLLEIDPAAAAEWAATLASGPLREEALRKISQIWASKNPANAEIWAAGLSDESERQTSLENVCLQFAQDNASEAVGIAEKYKLGTQSGTVMENLARRWAVQDFLAASAWVKAQPPGKSRDQMVMHLAFVQAATLPAEAARLVVEEIPNGPVQTEAVISVIYQWAGRDLPGAREWVGLFPASPLRDRAESELANMAATQSGEQQ